MKSCKKRGTSSTFPCKCQWLCVMRAFTQKMEEKCTTVDVPDLSLRDKEFCTGSSYEGGWRKGYGMQGFGKYTFPHGEVYEGDFWDGMMHGTGELRYKTAKGTAAVRGEWKNGNMTDRTVIFDEAVDYDKHDWKYCRMPDRRFAVEYETGLLPGGRSYPTPHQPTLKVPVGYCDTEEGVYDCKRQVVVKHDDVTKLVRGPHSREQKWILDNCRVAEDNLILGPREDLYETYLEPTQCLESPPAPLVNTRFKLKSEYSDIFETELQKTIREIKEHTLAAVPTELLLP